MTQCHMSNYSCQLIHSNGALQNEGTFVCVMINAQWTYWSDWYFDKSFLIFCIKDWNKFHFWRLRILAGILNILGDRLEHLPSAYLPYSISNLWELVLNQTKFLQSVSFDTCVKYFSNMNTDLKSRYVLDFSLLLSSKDQYLINFDWSDFWDMLSVYKS